MLEQAESFCSLFTTDQRSSISVEHHPRLGSPPGDGTTVSISLEQLDLVVLGLGRLGLERGTGDHFVRQLSKKPQCIDLIIVLADQKGQSLRLEGVSPRDLLWQV